MGSLYERRQNAYAELRETYKGVIGILSHFIARDSYTKNHSYRVSRYAQKIAETMKMDLSQIEDIRLAGLLHDLGKLKVSAEVIHKAMKLTDDEFSSVKEHPQQGVAMISAFGGPLKRIIPLILYHHEWYDGHGYPDGLSGEAIPLGARILAVADVYDALLSHRPYRPALGIDKALKEIEENKGRLYDPA